MKNYYLFCCFWIVLTFTCFSGVSAQHTVSGVVTDEAGESLPGVNILEQGTVNGVITDIDGKFKITVARPFSILRLSFIGFKDEVVSVEGKTTLNITLTSDMAQLDEIVVVGMGTQRKASVIGAISNVSMDDIKIPSRSLTNALAGRLAGAVVVQRTGELGADNSNFWIRGISTFGSNRSPLILVDGVERDMQDLSAEEVESVSILKDASATAVYGVRAANGVVLVTTRKGRIQKPVIEVRVESGISDLPMLPKYLDGVNYAHLSNEALRRINFSDEYIENTRNQSDPLLYPNVNWFDETYTRYSSNSQATVNVRGGGEIARYFVGFGYFNEVGNLKNSPDNDYDSNLKLDRYNFRSNVDISITKTTVIDLEVGGHLTDLHTPGLGQTLYGTTYSPAEELFMWSNQATPISNPVRIPIDVDANGNVIYGWGAPSQVGERNPAERLMGSGYNTEFRNQFTSQITVNQDLAKLIDGLEAKFSFSFDAYNLTRIHRKKTSSTYNINGRDEDGNLEISEIDKGEEFLNYSRALESNRAKELKFQMLYNKLIAKRHRVGAMMMYYQRDYIIGHAFTSIAALPYRRQGLATRVTYDFDSRYFVEFNLGYNGSENFPKENRFGYFPAAAAGWLVSNEAFWHNYFLVNSLKLKGSIGLVGSEALIGGQRYGYLTIYGPGSSSYPFGETPKDFTGIGLEREGVQDLTWEKGLKKNVGFELQMFDGDFSLDVDYFHERRTDILLARTSLPAIVGVNSVPFANLGEMVNRGIDGTVEFNKKIGRDGLIRAYGSFTYARDKILEMDDPDRNFAYRNRTGHKFGQNFGLIALGYFEDEHDIANSPKQNFGDVRPGDVKYMDINGDGIISADDEVPIGYSNVPEINYGFGLQAQYKGFDMGVFFRGQARVTYPLGGSYIPFREGVGKHNLFAEATDRWTVENPDQNAQYPRLFDGTSSNNWQRSTKTIYNGSFVRLSDVELGYTFKGGFLSQLSMSSLRVYGIANNVALFSKWKMWDPETGTNSGNTYPLQRKFNIGLRAAF